MLRLQRTSYAEVSQAKGPNRIESLGMNMILCPPHLVPVVNLEKQFPKCGLLIPGVPLRPSQERYEVVTVFKIILRPWLAFSLAFALIVQRQHLIKLLWETTTVLT